MADNGTETSALAQFSEATIKSASTVAISAIAGVIIILVVVAIASTVNFVIFGTRRTNLAFSAAVILIESVEAYSLGAAIGTFTVLGRSCREEESESEVFHL